MLSARRHAGDVQRVGSEGAGPDSAGAAGERRGDGECAEADARSDTESAANINILFLSEPD